MYMYILVTNSFSIKNSVSQQNLQKYIHTKSYKNTMHSHNWSIAIYIVMTVFLCSVCTVKQIAAMLYLCTYLCNCL